MLVHPDAELVRADTGFIFRLGLIAQDRIGNMWGLTARHVFEGTDKAEILTPSGEAFGTYYADDNQPIPGASDPTNQIVRFPIADDLIRPDQIRYDVIWPREPAERGQLLGMAVISTESKDRPIGTIVEVGSLARVELQRGKEPSILSGVIVLCLEDNSLVRTGLAGTLVLLETAEAVGLGIAMQSSDHNFEIVVCPVDQYLKHFDLHLWAPPGAHWTDLPQRVALFLRNARSDPGPDLGRRPEAVLRESR